MIRYVLLLVSLFSLLSNTAFAEGRKSDMPPIFQPNWTQSFKLYGQAHAIWLDRYKHIGDNLPLLKRTLDAAKQAGEVPEFVLYAIPLRDLGQSSEGGFGTYKDYLTDSRLNAEALAQYRQKTGTSPVIYLEPDSIPLAVQYRRDEHESPEARRIYDERIQAMQALIALYKKAGAKVYLEAGHSGWFDYGDTDIQCIASALNEAGIAQADGLASNVSNRQPVASTPFKAIQTNTEWHYLARLLPLLHNSHLDVRVDTSRNGGQTQARQYFLEGWLTTASDTKNLGSLDKPTLRQGRLWDNEQSTGRWIGSWQQDAVGELHLKPFFGSPKTLKRLLSKEKYQWQAEKALLIAPPWLDAVGDVQPGPVPTDQPPAAIAGTIQHYRYIKPPDDSDGALNFPAGVSKQRLNTETAARQNQRGMTAPPIFPWQKIREPS
jgi:hypothetical protein